MADPNAPKLILDDDWKSSKQEAAKPASGLSVDSDWKAQAQAERDRLAAEEQKKAESAAASGGGGGQGKLPPADFPALVGTLITQALMYMGAFPDPETGRAIVSLEHAKFHIDLLGVLAQKTKGNLTTEESEEIAGALVELRSRFVEITQAVAEAVKQRGAKGGMLGGPGGGMGGPLGGGGGLKF